MPWTLNEFMVIGQVLIEAGLPPRVTRRLERALAGCLGIAGNDADEPAVSGRRHQRRHSLTPQECRDMARCLRSVTAENVACALLRGEAFNRLSDKDHMEIAQVAAMQGSEAGGAMLASRCGHYARGLLAENVLPSKREVFRYLELCERFGRHCSEAAQTGGFWLEV